MSQQIHDQRPLRVEFQIHFEKGTCGRRHLRRGTRPKTPARPEKDIPRLARLLALAHRWNRLIEERVVSNHAEIARMMGLSRARVTQIMDLLYLAPDIQEQVLLPPSGEMPGLKLPDRAIRLITGIPAWTEQRGVWRGLRGF